MLRSHLRQARAKSSTHSDLRDLGQGDLSPERVEALADLSVTDASIMREHWPEIEVERRYHLIRHMIELMQTDVSKDFERALCVAASDPDVQNRRTAIRGLAEANSGRTVSTIVELLERELDESVIRQILETLGEIAQNARLSEEQIDSMRTAMVHQAEHGSSAVIRREALTAASALPADQLLHDLVSAAYRSSNEADQVFAVRAMGRIGVSYWRSEIERLLRHSDEEMRTEAVTAVGVSGDQRFSSDVVQMAFEEEEDVQLAAIWTLGELGGQMAVNALQQLAESDDPEVSAEATEALEHATLLEDFTSAPQSSAGRRGA